MRFGGSSPPLGILIFIPSNQRINYMRVLLLAIATLVLVSGCTQQISDDMQDEIGSPPTETDNFAYEKDGRVYTVYLQPGFNEAMTWIKENLPDDAVISAWWDYGHMIRGLAEREAIIFNPSEEILYTVSMITAGGEFDKDNLGYLSNHEDIERVAMALSTTNASEAIAIMEYYHSDYIMITVHERVKSWVIYDVSGVEAEQLDEYTLVNEDSMMYRVLNGDYIEGFEKVYSDTAVFIYMVT